MNEHLLVVHILSGLTAVITVSWYFLNVKNTLTLKLLIVSSNVVLAVSGLALFLTGTHLLRLCSPAAAYGVFLGVGAVIAHRKHLTGCPYLDSLES